MDSDKNRFFENESKNTQKFRYLVGKQIETEIVHFVEQNLFYNLTYRTKFQL